MLKFVHKLYCIFLVLTKTKKYNNKSCIIKGDDKMKYRIMYKDGKIEEKEVVKRQKDEKIILSILKENIPDNTLYIDFCPDFLVSGIDAEGYCLAPRGTKEGGTMLCRFREREDCEYISDSNTMPVFGFKTTEKSIFAIVTGMTFEYKIIIGVKDNNYYIYPRFFVDEKTRYEDIEIEYYELPKGSDYNDMAALYKKIKKPVPLSERVKENEYLSYASKAPEIRIRLAWKPVPSPVKCQDEENEPEVVIGCTFKRVKDILKGLKEKGVKKAEVCLVGVETKGHDGRWPQLLPIEESIGGQDELEELCRYGQSLGYQMVIHTNNTEMYQISNDWNENDLIVTNTGDYSKDEILWGGGQPFHICPKQTVKFVERNNEEIKKMGFKGLHYIDVFTNFPPRNCYSPLHPSTARESAKTICEIAEMTRKTFGGFACEGGFDYASDVLDYVLYTSYNLYGKQHPICDETIPFWQLVFHGSILYNPSTETVNYCVKDEKSHLKFIEYGGRPLAYFNSKYVDEGGCGNWMGEEDLLCATDEILDDSLNRIKKIYDEYLELYPLQFEEMVRHDKISEGVYRVTYSDNTVVTVDYNKECFKVEKK